MKSINNVVILSQLVRHLSAVHITVQSLYIFQLKLFTYCNTIKSESLYILSNTMSVFIAVQSVGSTNSTKISALTALQSVNIAVYKVCT